MRVIICGSGHVGSSIAQYLCGGNDIVLIDQSADVVSKMTSTLDIQGIVGWAAHPDVLMRARADKADMLIAVTNNDEVNMVTCQIAHSVFKVPTKIARIRNQSYLDPKWGEIFSGKGLGVDLLISPETEVAHTIARWVSVSGALDNITLGEGAVTILSIRCTSQTPFIGVSSEEIQAALPPEFSLMILAILRDDKVQLARPSTRLEPEDEVYFAVATHHIDSALIAFGIHPSASRHLIIIGGGNIGIELAKTVCHHNPNIHVKVLEKKPEQAQYASQQLPECIVLNGDALDPDILTEANVQEAETVVAVTNDDRVNLLTCLLTKKLGAQRALILTNSTGYTALKTSLGIDGIIDPRAITVSSILQYVRRGRVRSLSVLKDGFGEVIEAEVMETSDIIGHTVEELEQDLEIKIAALIRDQKVTTVTPHTAIRVHDRVVVLAIAEAVKNAEKLFSVRAEYL